MGLDCAEEGDVATSVVIATGKQRFYQSCGFGPVVGRAIEGKGNPLAGIAGGEILFRDRKSVRGSAV